MQTSHHWGSEDYFSTDKTHGVQITSGSNRHSHMNAAIQIVTYVPASTTRRVGIWKKLVASVALLERPM